MTDAATLPAADTSTNGAGSRQQRLAAAVKNLRSRQSLSSIPVDRWVLIAGAIMVPLGIALIILAWYGASHKALIIQQFPYLLSGGLLGLGLMIAGARFDYRRLRALAPGLVLGSLGLCLLVLVAGTRVNGARRWLSLGPAASRAREPHEHARARGGD